MPDGSGNKIAEAYVEVRVNAEQVKPELDNTEREVEESTRRIGKNAEENIGGGFKAAGEDVEKTTEGVRKLQGALSSTVGIVTGLIGVFGVVVGLAFRMGKAIGEWTDNLRDADRAANDFRLSIQNTSVEELRNQVKETADGVSRIEGLWQRVLNSVNLTTDRQNKIRALENELNFAIERRVDALRSAREEREREAEVAKKVAQQQVDVNLFGQAYDQLNQLETQMLDGIDRIERERYNAFIQTMTKMDAAEDGRTKAMLSRLLEIQDAYYDAEVKKFEEAERKKTAIAEREIQKRAQAEDLAIERLFNKITTNQGQLGSLTGTIETLADRVEAAIYASGQTSSVRRS